MSLAHGVFMMCVRVRYWMDLWRYLILAGFHVPLLAWTSMDFAVDLALGHFLTVQVATTPHPTKTATP